jgi:hypothetical protein
MLGTALGVASCLLGCEDEDVIYQGSFASELTTAPETTPEAEPVAYECVPTPSACPAEPAAVPSYAGQIAGIIAQHCGSCHLENNLGGPWPFSQWIDVYDWVSSIRISLEQCLMPPPDTDAPLTPADRETLQTWLACGAPNN